MHPIFSFISDSKIPIFLRYTYIFDTKSHWATCNRRIWVNKIHLHTCCVACVSTNVYDNAIGEKEGGGIEKKTQIN